MDINPSKSILDQVDEYLHDNNDILDNSHNSTVRSSTVDTHIQEDVHLLEKELDTQQESNDVKPKNQPWISNNNNNNIQINLDQLSESLFRENYTNTNKTSDTSKDQNNMFRDDNDRNNLMNGHHSLMTDINDFTNGYYENTSNNHNTTVNTSNGNNNNSMIQHPNELSHMLNIPTDLLFSPSASPLIAPNQASMGGIQVTPFMQPLTLKNDSNYGVNHPFLGDPASVLDTTNTFNNSNNRKTSLDNTPNFHQGSNGLILMDEDIDNDPDMIPLTRSKTSTSKNSDRNSNNNNNNNNTSSNNNNSKKSHSISGQSTTRSESNSKIVKNSPYLKANRSRRRFSKSRNSLENTPILSSTNVTTTTTPNTNTINSNNNIQNNNNNSDEGLFQLPDSSVGSSGHTTPLSANIGYNTTLPNGNIGNEIKMMKGKNKNNTSNSNNSNDNDTIKQDNNSPIVPEKRARSRSRVGRVKDDSKKEIHKVAEQERRNRLNNALTELGSLIPEELKKTVSIPSKATTAELACVYIRQLQDALDDRDL